MPVWLVKRRTWETHRHTGRMPCEGKGRDRGDASTASGHLRLPESQQKLGERPRTVFLTACRRTLTQLWEGRVREGLLEEVTELNCKSWIVRTQQRVVRWGGGVGCQNGIGGNGVAGGKHWDEKQLGSRHWWCGEPFWKQEVGREKSTPRIWPAQGVGCTPTGKDIADMSPHLLRVHSLVSQAGNPLGNTQPPAPVPSPSTAEPWWCDFLVSWNWSLDGDSSLSSRERNTVFLDCSGPSLGTGRPSCLLPEILWFQR